VLREAGLVKVSPEEAVATGVSRAFFPHGIGHGLGLQVHDVGGFAASDRGGTIPRPDGHPYLRLTRVLEPGFVVTIEPGIYVPGRGGVRIEDTIIVTQGPARVITPASKELRIV